eukprot:825760-Pelagomonas_calceolata.AAC.1
MTVFPCLKHWFLASTQPLLPSLHLWQESLGDSGAQGSFGLGLQPDIQLQPTLLDRSHSAASLLLLPALGHACTGELPASRLEAHQWMGAATHVTPARLHGRQPVVCHGSTAFSVVQHMSGRVLCPSAAWGCILGSDGLLGIKLDLFQGLAKLEKVFFKDASNCERPR